MAKRGVEGRGVHTDFRIVATALSGLGLALSFIPGLEAVAIVSIIFGSVEAVRATADSIRDRKLDVNLLMLIAAAGAVAVERATDAAGLLFLFSLSTTLESFAMAKTRSAIEALVKLRPASAIRVTADGDRQVPVEDLRVSDVIRIAAYENIPADATVVEGHSRVDESAMTGESIPIDCHPGSNLVGGTQNLEGMLLARVDAEVGNSTLDKIVGLVREAQDNKASGERVSDWFGQRYTIFVLVAFGTSIGVRAALGQPSAVGFYSSLTLLVGMSPCALVISSPATTLSALAWCARHGMLVRGGEYIEAAGAVKIVAMDKTGTLTKGKPALVEAAMFGQKGGETNWCEGQAFPPELLEALRYAAAAEQYSNHPIARAIGDSVKGMGGPLPDLVDHVVVPGLGVEARTPDGLTSVGREALLLRQGRQIPPSVKAEIGRMEGKGFTVSLAAVPSGIVVLGLGDGLRTSAPGVVQEFYELGIDEVVILTGDRKEPAEEVRALVGATGCFAGLMPGEKTDRIKDLRARGPVMMVGDGVNDAPSLASADIGVAMGGLGSDIAMNSADVVLMRDRLELLPDLIALGRRTVGVIRANLAFAGLVVVTLTVSSLITTLPLPLAVIGHEGSTVLVILNGLRMLSGPRRSRSRASLDSRALA